MPQPTLDPNFQYSQSALQTFADCKRAFYLRYIQKLNWPSEQFSPQLQNEQQIRDGEYFHQIIQQYFLKIPVEKIEAQVVNYSDPKMFTWWSNFLTSVKHGEIDIEGAERCLPEFSITSLLGTRKLSAKVDLLVIRDGMLKIYDWKTNKNLPKPDLYHQSIQTQHYLTCIAHSSFLRARQQSTKIETIEMIYWFANYPSKPITISADGARSQFAERAIVEWIELVESEVNFEETSDIRRCGGCVYRSYCGRGQRASIIDEIEDDPFEGLDYEPSFEFDDPDF